MKLESYCATNEENKIVFNTNGKVITYYYLENKWNEIEEELEKNHKISNFEKQMNILFGYALDFITASEDKTIESLEHVHMNFVTSAICKTYMYEKERNIEELKDVLLKKIGAYELLVHYNWVVKNFYKNEIKLPLKIEIVSKNIFSSNVTDLVLNVNNEIFDVFEAVKYSIENEFVIDGEITPEMIKKFGINMEEIRRRCDKNSNEDGEENTEEDDEIKNPFIPVMDGFFQKARIYVKNLIDVFIPSQQKVGRNDPCTCGSGKKYKQCCGK